MNLTSLPLFAIVSLPVLLSCGKEGLEPEASRAIPGVILISNAEGASAAGFLTDSELGNAGAALHGGWYTYDDAKDCPLDEQPRKGMVNPAMMATFAVSAYALSGGLVAAPPGEEDNNDAAYRFWGGGYEEWGAGMGVGFNNQGMGPAVYDLTKTKATGIRFWARTGGTPGTEAVELKIKIQDKWSEGEAMPLACCLWEKETCGPNQCGASEQGCFDAPFVMRSLTTAWQKVEIPFTDFMRGGWGKWVEKGADGTSEIHAAELLALTEAYQLQVEVAHGIPAFDVWIDNVGFIIDAPAAK